MNKSVQLKNPFVIVIFLVIIVGVMLFAIPASQAKNEELKEKGVITSVTPDRIIKEDKGTGTTASGMKKQDWKYTAEFKYVVEGKNYTIRGITRSTEDRAQDDLDTITEVRYLPENPGTSKLLQH